MIFQIQLIDLNLQKNFREPIRFFHSVLTLYL